SLGTHLVARMLALQPCDVKLTSATGATASARARPRLLVRLGGHRLHVNCTGEGRPAVAIETGLGTSPSTGFAQKPTQPCYRLPIRFIGDLRLYSTSVRTMARL